jgi:hypothetical protein
MLEFFENSLQRFRQQPLFVQLFLKVALGLLLLLFAPSGSRLIGPLFLLLFWVVLSADNRTITLSTVIVFASIGLAGFMPLATILETPFILFLGKETLFSAVTCLVVETVLMAGILILLSIWPQSRLRYTSGILDFVIIGLSLGVGLECGINLLYPESAGYQGLALGLLPQLPGMLGSSQAPVACSSPAVWGMAFGLLTGVARYLIGPDFNGSWLRRGIVIGIAVSLLLWIAGERIGYIVHTEEGFWHTMYWIDLKGRLLAYLTGLLTLLAILVEWLLLQERSQNPALSQPWQAVKQAWKQEPKTSGFNRLCRVLRELELRGRRRELILAEEVKPILGFEDREKLKQRKIVVQHMLAGKGS